jgi:ABC-type uncharacterized transport system substrate-binding protein
MCFGLDYYKVGRICGEKALDVINGATPKEIGAIFLDDISQFNFILNLDRAKDLNINISDELLNSASYVVENGEMIKR